MTAGGGYQIGTDKSWQAFRCETCRHQEVVWGNVERDAAGVEHFKPSPKKILTVLIHLAPNDTCLCRGICEDTDIFNNVPYGTIDTAVKQIGKHYNARGFRVIFDLPKEAQS